MEIQIDLNKNNETIELDNGHQYISLSIKDAQKLQSRLNEILHDLKLDKNLEKDWNYLGGL